MAVGQKIISFFFPERCPYCSALIEAEEIACARCLQQLKEKQRPILRGAMGFRCVSSFIYDGAVRRMLIRIKFHDRIQHIRQAAAVLAKDIRTCYGDDCFDLITAVPMHPKDLRERGYNQCEILAKELAKLLELPFEMTLAKVKRTKKQHKLKYAERRKNLSGAFQLIDKDAVKGRRILIVDDIVTTGCTLGTCCKVLNRAKPAALCCAAIANAATSFDSSAVIWQLAGRC